MKPIPQETAGFYEHFPDSMSKECLLFNNIKSSMMDKIAFIIDWLEQSKLPTVIAAVLIMLFSIRQIWRGFK